MGSTSARRSSKSRRADKSKTVQKFLCRTVLFAGLMVLATLYSNLRSFDSTGQLEEITDDGARRFLQGSANQTNVAADKCPDVLDSDFDRESGLAMTVYILIMCFIFLGIAVVCDDYFCDSLEVICDVLELEEAVAGATFMAAGSSAPELATSLVTVFTTKDSTGLGTILGSAVFNLVMIICLSGLFGAGPNGKVKHSVYGKRDKSESEKTRLAALITFMPSEATGDEKVKEFKARGLRSPTEELEGFGFQEWINAQRVSKGENVLPDGLFLDWRPLARDALFYILALGLCVFFALTPVGDGWCNGNKFDKDGNTCKFDNKPGFVWWEGLVLSLCYGIYIHSMIKNKQLMDWMERAIGVPNHIKEFVNIKEVLEDSDEESEQEADGVDVETPTSKQDSERLPLLAAPDRLLSAQDVALTVPTSPTAAAVQDDLGPPPAGKAPAPTKLQETNKTRIEFNEGEIDELKTRIQALEEKVSWMKYDHPNQHEYQVVREEEEETSRVEQVIDVIAWPWSKAFQLTIPSCQRDSFQEWEDVKDATTYASLDRSIQVEMVKKYKYEREDIFFAEGEAGVSSSTPSAMIDGVEKFITDTELFTKSKFKAKKVDMWYEQSKRYIISFTMSIVWIGATSWAMVKTAEKIGCHVGVGPFMMGLVVLAAGTSIPDALSSIVVAKDGDGDMAVANAIGSNVFNIFLGIGLPMLISPFIWNEPFVVPDGLAVFTTTLMLIVITFIMVGALACNRWILSKTLSGILMSLFFIYILVNIAFDGGDPLIDLYGALCNNEEGSAWACRGVNDIPANYDTKWD